MHSARLAGSLRAVATMERRLASARRLMRLLVCGAERVVTCDVRLLLASC